MADQAHRQTDNLLATLEQRIAGVYRDAQRDVAVMAADYFDKFRLRDAEQLALLRAGKITEEYYKQWRLAQIGRGERFTAMQNQIAERMTRANEQAVAYINDLTPGVYTLNRNYAAYTIEQVAGNVGFTLYDEQMVKRLFVLQPDLMPNYPLSRAVARGIDLAYGKRQILAQVTQSLLMGDSIQHIADKLQQRIADMNRTSAVRAARTAVTGAENAGRVDSYDAAEKMGIHVKKRWLATLDGRTRHSHAMLDGASVENSEKFGNGCRFPGDPNGPGNEIYNCRCTIIADLGKGFMGTRRARDPVTGEREVVEDMTYKEWAARKKEPQSSVNGAFRRSSNTGAFSELPERMSKKYIREVAKSVGFDLTGFIVNVDKNEELLRFPITGEAVPEHIGEITFFPCAFRSREELIRTMFHESVHVRQFREYGVEYVQNNLDVFEKQAYNEEDEYIERLKKRGLL